MIEKVQFRNFKAYRSLDLELEPFTVLVGPNASGKTTLLEGLRMPAMLHSLQMHRIPESFRSFGASKPSTLRFQSRIDGFPAEVLVEGPGSTAVRNFVYSAVDESARQGILKVSEELRWILASAVLLRLDSKKLAEASYSDDQEPGLSSDGLGLASALAFLKLSHEDLFEEIESALKQIVPTVRKIRVERAAVERSSLRTLALDAQTTHVAETRTLWGNRIVLDMQGAKAVPADSVGEGTLMALGLLTVLLGKRRPRFLLLDDIELALHPVAQGKLIDLLRAIQKNSPGLQIVATSHSPFILNYLKPEEIRMTFLEENGFARCEKLTAHPEFEKWKDLMSPGEFWSTVGESWIGKVPASATHE
ncbi:AAA family ATPase [Corallococcus sp. CA054B]|uniref:AAA family ATPase n=1 Tax=Corallococcus sp. CA054B TaxID=2316734 RepID=UPI0013155E79|nr:ATP-binding protein [Corallococcus sp. CA054B]